MVAIFKSIAMLGGALVGMVVIGLLFVLVEPFGFLGELVLVLILIGVPLFFLELKVARGEIRGFFDTPSPLPSFAEGFPVRIEAPGRTITIDDQNVQVRVPSVLESLWRNFTWLLRRDFDEPVTGYHSVRLEGKYKEISGGEAPPGRQLTLRVTLAHPLRNKTLVLGQRTWGGLETVDDFTDYRVQPLRKLCEDAANTLSLPVAEQGVLTRKALEKESLGFFW